MVTMLTIGEFSTVTRLTVKALRIYHEAGFLVPEKIDGDNGYRYYGKASLARATAIRTLRELGFSIKEMEDIFSQCTEEEELTAFLERKLEETDKELRRYTAVKEQLVLLLREEETEMGTSMDDVIEKTIPDQIICSARFKGRYDQIGPYFGKLFAAAGRYGARQPFALYHDGDYKEEDADIEAAVAVRQSFAAPPGFSCRVLAGGKAVCVIHRGPYDTLGDSYTKLFNYCREKGYVIQVPTREIYLKGPGMILPRNPKNFITEIVALV